MFILCQQIIETAFDHMAAARLFAFNIQRHIRVMKGQPQKSPAFGKYKTHTLIRRGRDGDPPVKSGLFQRLQHFIAVTMNIVDAADSQAVFSGLSRLF